MEILIKALVISLFCVGLRIISSKGMIFYFLRIPFESATGIFKMALKPIIGCCTCMASFWTVSIDFIYYNDLSIKTILVAFIVAAFNSIIHASYEKLSHD